MLYAAFTRRLIIEGIANFAISPFKGAAPSRVSLSCAFFPIYAPPFQQKVLLYQYISLSLIHILALVIVEAALYFLVLSDFVSLDIYLAAVAVVMAAGSIGMYAWIGNGGCRTFDAL